MEDEEEGDGMMDEGEEMSSEVQRQLWTQDNTATRYRQRHRTDTARDADRQTGR